ncbi:MAG: BON domain-containing protein [Beijerinckiaceae bacterium]
MSDRNLHQAVLDELEWDPAVNAAHIGVIAENGVVTLTGHVGSYAEKIAAEAAVKRVTGVRGVAQEIEVRYPMERKTADDQIARRALDILSWSTTIPSEKIQVKVQDGFVTLSGDANWWYQKLDAENAVRKLSGVKGITNNITVKPRVAAMDVKQRIETALKRNAEVEADSIQVSVSGGTVTLDGKVKAWYERDLAEQTAWSAPGVSVVNDRIAVGR